MHIWIDVEDLFQYASNTSRPSGIQRLSFEVHRALVALSPRQVHFVRHKSDGKGFVSVRYAELAALFDGLTDTAAAPPPPPPRELPVEAPVPPPPPVGRARRLGRRILARLPPDVARGLRNYRVHQLEAIRYIRDMVYDRVRRYRAAPAAAPEIPTAPAPSVLADVKSLWQEPESPFVAARQGDWLLCLGSPWFLEDYAGLVSSACHQHDMRFGVLIYDIIPIRRPEWCDRNLVRVFRAWFQSVLPHADMVLSISDMTSRDVEAYVAEAGIPLRSRVQTIPLGAGFGQKPAAVRTGRLPPRRSFALIVSTIEARKNHILLFRLWRELLAILPRDEVPTLVFAGRVGWLVADLMQQLRNADWLDGKILLIEEPSDGELTALYEDCLFTLYPSLYEGWGLPVTESLVHGAPCLAANKTSVPEAGGTLARYFDPDNLHDALHATRAVLDDPVALEEWRREIRKAFANPPGWDVTAVAIRRILQSANTAMEPGTGVEPQTPERHVTPAPATTATTATAAPC